MLEKYLHPIMVQLQNYKVKKCSKRIIKKLNLNLVAIQSAAEDP